MDSNNNSINNHIIKGFLSSLPLGVFGSMNTSIASVNCLDDTELYRVSTSNPTTLKLIPDNIAKELHEAIALGGESVKKVLAVCYEDAYTLEAMSTLVDTCIAYIGEEVTAILRKYSNI